MHFFEPVWLLDHSDVEFLLDCAPFYLLDVPLNEVIVFEFTGLTLAVLHFFEVFFIQFILVRVLRAPDYFC